MHSRADGQETAVSPVLWAPTGTAVRVSAHAVPFQCQASAWLGPVPTAMQLPVAWHDTPVGRPCDAPVGSDIGPIVHPAAALAAPGQLTASASAATRPSMFRLISPPSARAARDREQRESGHEQG